MRLTEAISRRFHLKISGHLTCDKNNFSPFAARAARQNRPIEPLQKRKPFIRLSFGEKHIIAKFIKENPNKTYPEYAKYFTDAWNRTVTARLVIRLKFISS